MYNLFYIYKRLFLFSLYIFIYLCIDIFHILPTSILYYNNEKEKYLHICQSIFLFIIQMYFHKNISLYKKAIFVCFFKFMNTFIIDSFPPQLHNKLLKSIFFSFFS